MRYVVNPERNLNAAIPTLHYVPNDEELPDKKKEKDRNEISQELAEFMSKLID